MQKKLIMLCGIPTSGKSTFVEWYLKNVDTPSFITTVVVSSDYFIEVFAKSRNLTYDDVFQEYVGKANELMFSLKDFAVREGRSIIWDQTNLNPKTRKYKLNSVPEDYEKIAVYFEVDQETIRQRNQNRPGKTIPDGVLISMQQSFVIPTVEEGFSSVYTPEQFIQQFS